MEALDDIPQVRCSGFHLLKHRVVLDDSDLAERNAKVDWTRVRTLLDRNAKAGQYVTAHTWANPELFRILREIGYVSLFVVRDPRDIVISEAAYMTRLSRHPQHHRFAHELHSDQERFLAIIQGFPASRNCPGSVSLAERLRGYAPWLSQQNVVTCRFEDLIGPSGGGSAAAQVRALVAVGEHIDCPLSPAEAGHLAERIWSPNAATFRAGKIGQWRERFDESTRAAFDGSVSDELLAAYGFRR
jgi:hypothetical protein